MKAIFVRGNLKNRPSVKGGKSAPNTKGSPMEKKTWRLFS